MRGGKNVKLLPGLDEWLDAFWRLSTERQIGMAVGPIPDSAITRWIADNNLKSEAKTFRRCIRAMDNVYLNYLAQGDKVDRIIDEPFRPGMLRGKT